ncbi:MAG: isoamylase early set domain-containing protein [Candidatus Krumholzibacteria bacterium]|nr:isoamylase early set domain-containing protein [Candidatus Krumholzibacteria bacterium]MDH4336316.1 isoamylase early set domain-containing protein [Candidatus Krumholzibacteria bacterium]MDH5270951.1 isoamylase early set domain-containing protein [Candidatus Krumholzibacteria bacterium]
MKSGVVFAMFVLVLAGCAGPKPPPRTGGPELVGGGALFRYRNSDAKKVYLVGDFNDWAPSTDPMTDENGDGEWTLFYPLGPGRYAYKFVVDGRSWIADPTNPETEADGFDGWNSVLVIPELTP